MKKYPIDGIERTMPDSNAELEARVAVLEHRMTDLEEVVEKLVKKLAEK